MIAGEQLAEPRLRLIVEDRAGRRGVVMGEDDQRALGLGIAAAGDHVPGRPQRRGRAAEHPRAVGDVVGDRRRDQRRGGARERGASVVAAPRQPATAPAAASMPITRA